LRHNTLYLWYEWLCWYNILSKRNAEIPKPNTYKRIQCWQPEVLRKPCDAFVCHVSVKITRICEWACPQRIALGGNRLPEKTHAQYVFTRIDTLHFTCMVIFSCDGIWTQMKRHRSPCGVQSSTELNFNPYKKFVFFPEICRNNERDLNYCWWHLQFKGRSIGIPSIFSSQADRVSSVGIARLYGLDGPRIESRWGENFRTCPDRLWGPPSLIYNGYRVFPGGKAIGAWRWPPTPFSAEVKGRVEPYLYSPPGPSWTVLGWTLPLPLPN
jgi:hypothetical protein